MRIGIVAQEQGESVGVHLDYITLVERFGTPVILSPLDKSQFFSTYKLDGLLLPGGADVNPRRYGAWFSYLSGRPNNFLEHFDMEILPTYLEASDFPIFGICRGEQTLNVALGGTLVQHLWRHPTSASKRDLVHKVKAGRQTFGVNSFHHQAIGKLSPKLTALAMSDDGIIEAVGHPTKPIFGVQWHPERIQDDFSLKLMSQIFS